MYNNKLCIFGVEDINVLEVGSLRARWVVKFTLNWPTKSQFLAHEIILTYFCPEQVHYNTHINNNEKKYVLLMGYIQMGKFCL